MKTKTLPSHAHHHDLWLEGILTRIVFILVLFFFFFFFFFFFSRNRAQSASNVPCRNLPCSSNRSRAPAPRPCISSEMDGAKASTPRVPKSVPTTHLSPTSRDADLTLASLASFSFMFASSRMRCVSSPQPTSSLR
ncbi:hypothetical protein LY76DRAFT_26700 [Colletotrichum caudatum]|nr:hypothetical protein LY76DRAFT_26700 [Colletotrichum caudatum]